MFGLGYPELLVIGLVALVVIGPRRLPELMRQAGRLSLQVRRAANEFRRELELSASEEEPGRRSVPRDGATNAPEKPGSPSSAEEAVTSRRGDGA